jgi:NAD+ synthetase
MKIAVCQINNIIGDIEENKKIILDEYARASRDGADIAVFPELALVGYPPQDLVEKKEFRNRIAIATEEIASQTGKTALLFGAISEFNDNVGTGVYNSAVLCYDGEIQFIQHKTLIPNYDVFDEVRYFEAAPDVAVHKFRGETLGISICEDIWNDADYWKKRRYALDPVSELVKQGATLLLNISASPYSYGKREARRKMLSSLTRNNSIPLVYVCYTGAQTELVFDGASMCFNSNGELCSLGKAFEEDYFIFDTTRDYNPVEKAESSFEEEVYDALVLGIRDYCSKTGFKKALLGLSGGIDSALVACLAVKALGKENVHCILMPSQYSSKGSVDDSLKLIENLDITYNTISIEPVFGAVQEVLEPVFESLPHGLTNENIQPRIRGLYLMALSNKYGYMLLTTGNKSEMGVGYATLYGDMCGALAVIGDVYKTDVYRLSHFINRDKEIIPVEIIEKAPSAELRPNQKDQDSLPPYDQLDRILRMYLEENKELKEITAVIADSEMVKRTLHLVDMNEFKRKQSAPVLRVSKKAFGYGRRYPIVQGWRKNV